MQSIGQPLPKSRPIEGNPTEYLLGIESQQLALRRQEPRLLGFA